MPRLIAIDGPAASGKSTIGYSLARQLDYVYFDTGIMYRAVTWAVLDRGIDPEDAEAVTELARNLSVDIQAPRPGEDDGRQATVRVSGKDITWHIRTPDVDRNVSTIATYPGVRTALTRQQRRIAEHYQSGRAEKAGLVMMGRDIGTVVFPDAPLKVYLDAPVEERARRRHQELEKRGKDVGFDQVLAELRERDRIDTERAVAPLRPAEDAYVLDTTDLTPDEVVCSVADLVVQMAGNAETNMVNGTGMADKCRRRK